MYGQRVFAALLALGVATSPAAARDAGLELGGAVRFNYVWRDYGGSAGNNELDLELLRVDAGGHAGPLFFSLQYRWYDGFDAVHHAWAGWRVDEDRDLRAGVVKVPFGLLPYASHSFWFGSGYYLGIEDDYDLGVVWRDARGERRWHAGLFFGDEYGTGARFGRYSFDVATTAALPYRERERINLRYARDIDRGGEWTMELGASAFAGRVEHRPSGRRHDHRGMALHGQFARGPLTLQLQWAHYEYWVPEPRIALSAFMFPFEIAARGDVLTANLAWDFARTGWFDGITCYNNLSTTQASGTGLRDSWQSVTGCSFAKGPMFAYVDWIAGRNMWFVGGPGVGIDEPGGDRWRSRLNVNIGFYF
ncbi:hypothetical protein [Rehaibacterium terrae]|jgi:hypothetical protein|uniref:Phosphate-selective porin O and P n=1 Tax=Rehaibacterium terrae TaxID=1341696 RepID=A0A7W7XXX6_9GAMM|nr:hypothetical protein [Rehaibacterium terrae]MBB5014229.1 hypothetical protein [Rehaibacterium terrae]